MSRGGAIAGRRRGFTLVELMVGGAVAMLVVATTSTTVVASLNADRAMLTESRLMQDLRTATDLVGRDLRRGGYWGAAASGVRIDGAAPAAANPYVDADPGTAATDHVEFRYSRDTLENGSVDGTEQFGFRLRAGAVEFQLGTGNWQSITDANTMVVDAFVITPTLVEIDLEALCDLPCPAGDATCPPHQRVRSVGVRIAGHATSDARVQRGLQTQVRVRNDAVVGACAA